MDGQDHKKPIASAGHEVHGVYLCHRCGWPFPNSHPSAKHRRAHKRVCGTIEGYKISQSDLAIWDDEHASDEDEQHTPSPKIEKSNAKEPGSGGLVRERSNKSEDDVFSDAATDFSDSGISPSLEERLAIIKGDDKKIVQKSVEGNNNVNLLKKVDESAEITEKPDHPIRSDQMYTGSKAVPFELGDHLQSEDTKYDSLKSVHIQLEGDNSASACLNSKEEKASDLALVAAEGKDEPHDKLDGSTHVSDATKFTAVEDEPESEDIREPLAGKSDTFVPTETSGDDVDSSKEKCSVATVSIPVLKNSFTPEDDSTTRVHEENGNPRDGKANCELSVAGSESGKGAPMEEQVILDSSKPSVNSTDLLPSGEMDVDPRQLEDLSKTDSSLLEFKDVEFMRSHRGFEAGNETRLNIGLNLGAPDVVGVKSVGDVANVVDDSNRGGEVEFSEKTQEQPISKDSTNIPYSESLVLVENSATDNGFTEDVPKSSESIDVVQMDTEQKHDGSAVILPDTSDSYPSKVQETSSVEEKCLHETDSDKNHPTENFSRPESVGIAEETPDKFSISKLSIEPVSSPLHSQISNENSTDDIKISGGENATVDSKSLQGEGDTNDKTINEKDSVSATDSLEGKWGSISGFETNSQASPKSETNMQNSKSTNNKGHQSKSDDFEPPSFMTLVQSGKVLDSVAAAPTASEIEPVHNNQQQKSESLQAVWFPSLTNVVNDSEGRKKNEEIISKVINWNSGKEHHSPLKNLLNEAKSPNTKRQKDETSHRDNGAAAGTTVSSVLEPEEPKPETPHKEDWNSPARYPTMIKKEKKKGKPYWVPFVCCSSVNRDL